jgi:hypothetical protein
MLDMSKRLEYLNALRSNTHNLKNVILEDCIDAIFKAYSKSSLASKLARVNTTNEIENKSLKSIGLHELIKLHDFNDHMFSWNYYFSQVGQIVAEGEEIYFQDEVCKSLGNPPEQISVKNPDFNILERSILSLMQDNRSPDTILIPISIESKFIIHYNDAINFNSINTEGNWKFFINGIWVNVLIVNPHAKFDDIVIFNSKAGEWSFLKDPFSGKSITIVIGESNTSPGNVEFWVETLSQYNLLDASAFKKIELSSQTTKD